MAFRARIRPFVPERLKLRRVVLLRKYRDWRSGFIFATSKCSFAEFPVEWATYERSFIDYPGQEQLALAKRRNQRLFAAAMGGTIVRPGEVFSVWKLAGRPSASKGYLPAAALKNGELTTDVGGAICLLSTALYNAALLSGMEILERKCHSVDSYGGGRYFELGRDAAVEFGYVDLRFRNPHSKAVRIAVEVSADSVRCSITASAPAERAFVLTVTEPEVLTGERRRPFQFRVRTTRFAVARGVRESEDLGWSIYSIPPELESLSPER